MNEKIPSVESRESKEKGHDVSVLLKFLRHGERTKEGALTDYGRAVTRERARESGHAQDDFHAVKAVGSSAGAASGAGMRAFETADIYANEIAGEKQYQSRIRDILNYETLKSPPPYDHTAVYNANLPVNFAELGDEEKAQAARMAQAAVMAHVAGLNTPEADAYRKETAGAFAHVVNHYRKLAKRLTNGSRVLVPAGTHGGTMEFLLQYALVRKDNDGNETVGFHDPMEIGGGFNPSEAYSVRIETDAQGKEKELVVTFDDPARSQSEEMRLDIGAVNELDEFYQTLHREEGA